MRLHVAAHCVPLTCDRHERKVRMHSFARSRARGSRYSSPPRVEVRSLSFHSHIGTFAPLSHLTAGRESLRAFDLIGALHRLLEALFHAAITVPQSRAINLLAALDTVSNFPLKKMMDHHGRRTSAWPPIVHTAIIFRPSSVICIQTTVLFRPLISTRLRSMTAYPSITSPVS
jgi:hypothetical protein